MDSDSDMETADNFGELLALLENRPEDEMAIDQTEKAPENPISTEMSPPRKALQDLTYEDLFGSPDKKKRKTIEDGNCSVNITKNAMAHLGSKPVEPSAIRTFSGPADKAQLVIDNFSKLRLYKNSISLYHEGSTPETALSVRNYGIEFVNLLSLAYWHKTKGAYVKNFWTTGVLARKQPGVRKSAKGNEYSIWEVSDLKQLDKNWIIFLFSSAATSSLLSSIPVGSVIDILSPSILTDSKTALIKLSINNSNQIQQIGNSKDFGYCQSKRKDGKDCTAVVNTWECCTCIHHAASELKKMNGGGKSWGRKGDGNRAVSFVKGTFFNQTPTPPMTKEEGVFTVNFGNPQSNLQRKTTMSSSSIPSQFSGKLNTRMELQGSSVCNELKRNTLGVGNANSISFKKEENRFLSSLPPTKTSSVKKPLNLDPFKTRHLTEKDREILAALSSPTKSTSDTKDDNKKQQACNAEIATRIVSNPTAGCRNFLKYLNGEKNDRKSNSSRNDPHNTSKKEAEPVSLTRETMRTMKKALDFVKLNGPIKKVDPNAVSKRKTTSNSTNSQSQTNSNKSNSGTKGRQRSIEVEFDFESDDFKKILNAKSAHEEHLQDVQEEEYFDKLEKKEAIENKLLNTFSIATNAVMCKECKYVALGQSDYCKEFQHQIRIVKATKRFFKCKDCGNRTMSLDRLPKHPCKQCRSSNWIAAPVGKEKQGPKLASEMLSVRGHEEKFIGSAGSKMFLNLEVS